MKMVPSWTREVLLQCKLGKYSVLGLGMLIYCIAHILLYPPPPCLNGRAHGLEFWHGGQVEGYVGQGHRSKVKVKRWRNVHCLRTLSMDLPKKKLLNTTGRNMTWGVFKAYAFFNIWICCVKNKFLIKHLLSSVSRVQLERDQWIVNLDMCYN